METGLLLWVGCIRKSLMLTHVLRTVMLFCNCTAVCCSLRSTVLSLCLDIQYSHTPNYGNHNYDQNLIKKILI
jgi:hypothetical protein